MIFYSKYNICIRHALTFLPPTSVFYTLVTIIIIMFTFICLIGEHYKIKENLNTIDWIYIQYCCWLSPLMATIFLFMVTFSMIMHHVMSQAKVVLNWVINMTLSLLFFIDLLPNCWDVVELKICRIKVHLKRLQELHNVIMSCWNKISRMFPKSAAWYSIHLAFHKKSKALLRAKEGHTYY